MPNDRKEIDRERMNPDQKQQRDVGKNPARKDDPSKSSADQKREDSARQAGQR